jgi:hypothetical protein
VKKILQSLLSKKNEGNLHARLSWLAELTQLDELAGLKLTLKHITAILNDTALATSEKIELIFAIEDAVHTSACHQLTSFAKVDNLKSDITNSIVEHNYIFSRTLFLTHAQLADISFNKAPDQQPSDLLKFTLIARGLIYGTHMLLWRYYEHAAVPANIWQQASSFYQLAETHLIAHQIGKPFNEDSKQSIKDLYLALLMLGSINFNNLTKLQIEMIHGILNAWIHKVKVSTSLSSHHVFFVDLQKDEGVMRIRNQRFPAKSLFWDMDGIELEIDLCLKLIAEHKKPEILQKLNTPSMPIFQEMLLFLKREWSRKEYKRQRRKETRKETSRSAAVSMGIAHVHEMLKQFDLTGQAVKSLVDGTLNDRRLATGVMMRGNTNTMVGGREKWTIHDESEFGLGSILQQENATHVKPNKLISIYSQTRDNLPAIGVVRNLKQLTAGKLKVGIELFTHTPDIAVLKKFDIKKEQDTKTDPLLNIHNQEFLGIFIPKQETTNQAASIILPKIDYMPNTFYSVVLNKHREIVKFQTPIESGDDWVRLSFPEELS